MHSIQFVLKLNSVNVRVPHTVFVQYEQSAITVLIVVVESVLENAPWNGISVQ